MPSLAVGVYVFDWVVLQSKYDDLVKNIFNRNQHRGISHILHYVCIDVFLFQLLWFLDWSLICLFATKQEERFELIYENAAFEVAPRNCGTTDRCSWIRGQ